MMLTCVLKRRKRVTDVWEGTQVKMWCGGERLVGSVSGASVKGEDEARVRVFR